MPQQPGAQLQPLAALPSAFSAVPVPLRVFLGHLSAHSVSPAAAHPFFAAPVCWRPPRRRLAASPSTPCLSCSCTPCCFFSLSHAEYLLAPCMARLPRSRQPPHVPLAASPCPPK